MGLDFEDLEELAADLKRVVDAFPDEAEIHLQSVGKKFRKAVIEKTPDSGREHKRKLKKSYRLSPVKGYREDMEIEFYSKAPHFHLVERGHMLVVNGQNKGFVPGVKMLERTVSEYEDVMPEDTAAWVDEMLRKLD